MRIAVDIRCLQEKSHSGIQEYVENLLPALLEIDKKNEYLLFSSGLKPASEISFVRRLLKNFPNVSLFHLKLPNKIFNQAAFLLREPKIDKILKEPDIFFAPNINFLPLGKNVRVAVTFHDLSFERYPEFFSFKGRLWHKMTRPRAIARRANKIIAVSRSTAADLQDLYGIGRDKIRVVYSAPAENKNSNETRHRLPPNSILYLGTLEPRKNIIGLIKAFNLLRGKTSARLVIAGHKGWNYKRIFREYEKSPFRKDIFFIGPVKPQERFSLIAQAAVFAFPSFFEGFGFPPLEAMACGVPVVSSNTSSLPEACADAALMVEPSKSREIARALEALLKNQKLRQELIKRGFRQAKKFSWQRTARETLEVLRHM